MHEPPPLVCPGVFFWTKNGATASVHGNATSSALVVGDCDTKFALDGECVLVASGAEDQLTSIIHTQFVISESCSPGHNKIA